MPTVLKVAGFRFFFYSLETTSHRISMSKHGENVAKYWLDPVRLANSYGFRSQELNKLRLLVIENRTVFQEAWNAHFGG